MTQAPERIWINYAAANKVDLAYDEPPITPFDDVSQEYVRADLAQAPAPVLWTQAQQIAFARAYDTEDAAHRGEPTPWFDEEEEWVDYRLACVRAGLTALEAPDAGVVAELVEAWDAARSHEGVKVSLRGEASRAGWDRFLAAMDKARAALAKLGVR